ncbi:hypothetical protein [Desulfocastanea catecholica]
MTRLATFSWEFDSSRENSISGCSEYNNDNNDNNDQLVCIKRVNSGTPAQPPSEYFATRSAFLAHSLNKMKNVRVRIFLMNQSSVIKPFTNLLACFLLTGDECIHIKQPIITKEFYDNTINEIKESPMCKMSRPIRLTELYAT